MRKAFMLMILIPLTATNAYAQKRHHCRQRAHAANSTLRGAYSGSDPAALNVTSGWHMPSAGEIEGCSGGYAHPEGCGSIGSP